MARTSLIRVLKRELQKAWFRRRHPHLAPGLLEREAAAREGSALDRVGGRAYTLEGFNEDGMFCELGGELVDTGHRDLRGLAAELGLQVQPFARGSYCCPTVGQYTTLVGSAGEPELEGRILFAGEHCSLANLGFMDGAVETGTAAARAALRMRRLPAGRRVG